MIRRNSIDMHETVAGSTSQEGHRVEQVEEIDLANLVKVLPVDKLGSVFGFIKEIQREKKKKERKAEELNEKIAKAKSSIQGPLLCETYFREVFRLDCGYYKTDEEIEHSNKVVKTLIQELGVVRIESERPYWEAKRELELLDPDFCETELLKEIAVDCFGDSIIKDIDWTNEEKRPFQLAKYLGVPDNTVQLIKNIIR